MFVIVWLITFQGMDVLWQDYLQKLQDQVQEPLQKYLTNIPAIKVNTDVSEHIQMLPHKHSRY